MNTPDTECEGCKHNKKYPNEDVTHTCPSTPDTEEAEKVAMRLYVDLKKLEAENFPPEEKVAVYKAIVSNLLTSRDTYWKEQIEKAREEERERIEAIFKEHVPPHAMDLEDSVWLKRLLNKAFQHENLY